MRTGTRLETRPRYTPTTCFETFPFPEPTDAQREAIAGAAKELDQLRNNWLNPPEWTRTDVLEFPGRTDGPWKRYISLECGGSTPLSFDGDGGGKNVEASRSDGASDDSGNDPVESTSQSGAESPHSRIGTVRYPRVVPRDEDCAKKLKKRTLTNLYNERPTWLDLAHQKLDEAVFAAYGWPPDLSDDDLLAKLLELNLQRAE